jgi:hypothetical protein
MPTRDHGDLRASTRLARRRLDRHDPLVHLGNFLFEALGQHLDAGAGEHDLRALGRLVDVHDVGAQPIVGAVGLARDLLRERQDGLRTSEVHDDCTLLEAPDDPVDDLALAVLVLLVDVLALGFANALDDHLLGGLREDAPEARGVHLDADLVAHLRVGIEAPRLLLGDLRRRVGDLVDHLAELEELDLSQILVEAGIDLHLLAPLLARGLLHRLLEGGDDFSGLDALVFRDLVDLAFQTQHVHAVICRWCSPSRLPRMGFPPRGRPPTTSRRLPRR